MIKFETDCSYKVRNYYGKSIKIRVLDRFDNYILVKVGCWEVASYKLKFTRRGNEVIRGRMLTCYAKDKIN